MEVRYSSYLHLFFLAALCGCASMSDDAPDGLREEDECLTLTFDITVVPVRSA